MGSAGSDGLDGQRLLQDELRIECEVMITYVLQSGMRLPPPALPALTILATWREPSANGTVSTSPAQDTGEALGQLALAHEQLAQLVAPATPRTLMYVAGTSRKGFWKFLGPIRMIGSIVACALAFLLAFVLMSILLNKYPGSKNTLIYPIHLLAAAGMGGSFSALFEASSYIVSSTFDPRYKGYYWVKIVLGLTAGYILAQLIPIGAGPDKAGVATSLAPATLALLGGFSGTVVYNILKRLSESVESMVQGSPQVAVAAQQSAARAQASEAVSRAKMTHAASLIELQNLLAEKASPDDVRKRITQLVSDLGVGTPESPTDSVTSTDDAPKTPETQKQTAETAGEQVPSQEPESKPAGSEPQPVPAPSAEQDVKNQAEQ